MGQPLRPEHRVILIVEDEPFIRYDLVDFFEDAGFAVFDAEDADAAVILLQANPLIGVVLTDVNMPGSMDGVELAHFVHDRFAPMLVLVASGAVKLDAEDLPIGAMFFPKPYDPRAVLRSIDGVSS